MLPFHLIGHPIVHSPQLVRREREVYRQGGGEGEEREGGERGRARKGWAREIVPEG